MSRSLPTSAEVVIIGGGVMGTSIAFHLAEAGVREVVLLEREALAAGSTARSAGGVRAQFSDPVNIALGARSLSAFEDFARRPGAQIDLQQVGYLFLHSDPVTWQAVPETVAQQHRQGVPTQVLDPEQARQLAPAVVTDDLLGATFHPRDGYCSPEAVVQGYATAARNLGATVAVGVSATGIRCRGREITTVSTSAGEIATSTVICAAGAWSAEVGGWVDHELPVSPLRRQIVVSEPLSPAQQLRFSEQTPMTIDVSTTLYFHREGPGLLIGMSYVGERPGFDTSYSDAWSDDLAEAMAARAPELLDLGIAHSWAGLYETTPDHNALLGEATQVSRFLYATGFSGHGFLQGPAVGEVIRDLYLRQTPPIDVSAFSARRFAGERPITELRIV